MTKLFRFYLTGLIFSVLFLFINFSVFADVQIYPPAGSTTPYGNGAANVTGDGWTDNHMMGQSFIVSDGVGKVNTVQLSNFKLGDTKNSGLYSVALFQGEPGVSGGVIPGYDGSTTTFITTGAKLAQVEKIFIPGQMGGVSAEMCGIPSNSPEASLLTRMKINNPNRPCPKLSELTRMWCLWGGRNAIPGSWSCDMSSQPYPVYQDLLDQWVSGCDLCDGMGTPWEPRVNQGESDLLWGTDWENERNLPSYYEGPGSDPCNNSWCSYGGGKNRIADISFKVKMPDNVVIPGQPYFISIQGSHMDNGAKNWDEGGYYEQGRYNCEMPNESGPVSFEATKTDGSVISIGTNYCGKDNVMVADISTDNPYGSGTSYFNTSYYGINSGDVTNLIISGETVAVPNATVSGPATGAINHTLTYTGNSLSGGMDSDLTYSRLYVVKQDQSNASIWGCPQGNIVNNIFCLIVGQDVSGQSATISGNWVPTVDGNYYVLVNAYDGNGNKCTGNPWSLAQGWSYCDSGNPRADYMTVVIKTPPTGEVRGPTTGKIGDSLAYVGTVTDGGGGTGLSKAQLYVIKADGLDSSLWCTGAVEGVNKEWCKLGGDESMSGASGTISRTWIPKINTPNGTYHIVVNAYNYNIDPDDALKCSGNPWGVTSPWVDCGANDYLAVNIQTTDCTVTNFSPTSGCYSSFPTLSASMGNGANKLQFAVDTDNGFASPWTCNSGWSSSTTYNSCSIGTGNYYWGASSKDDPTGSCTTPAAPLPIPGNSFSIDQTGPAAPATCTASYNSGTNSVDFSWTPSTDVGCASDAIANKASSYWLQGRWEEPGVPPTPGGWFKNAWEMPASYATPTFSQSCSGNDGQISQLLVRQSKDSLSNVGTDRTEDWTVACQAQCPAPPPTLGELQVVANTSTGATPKSVSANGLREDDSTATGIGHNINNALQITQNALSAIEPPNNIALVGTAFTGTIAAPSTLQDLKSGITAGNNGFILIYANKDVVLASGPIASLCPSGQTNNFCAGRYYAYTNSQQWQQVTQNATGINVILNLQVGANIRVKLDTTNPPKSPDLSVTFYKLLGSQKWSTYGYLMDAYNQTNGQNNEIIQSKAPVVLTP